MLKTLLRRLFPRPSPACVACGRPSERAQRLDFQPTPDLTLELYACQDCADIEGRDRARFYRLMYSAQRSAAPPD